MKLSTRPPDLRSGARYVARAPWLPPLLTALATFAITATGAIGLWNVAGEIPLFFWIVLGPIVLLAGPLFLLLGWTFVEVFWATLRETNWLACVQRHGICLNLRSYRNGHFEGPDPTVATLEFREIESVGPVVENRVEFGDRQRRRVRSKWIELVLKNEASTEDLEIACFLERTREAPTTETAGVSSRTKHHHVPVFVHRPGVVRLEWEPGLYEVLAQQVAAAPLRRVDLDAEFETLAVEERAEELLRRGQRMGAIRALRASGWKHDDVQRWLDAERVRAA